MDQLPRLGKRELICLLLFTCNYVEFVSRGFLFLWVLGMGYVILLWHSLSLPYNYLLVIKKSCFHNQTKALPRLCKLFHLKMTCTFCTDDVRVKVSSFQKVTQFLQYKTFQRDVIHLNFVCLKIFLTAVI